MLLLLEWILCCKRGMGNEIHHQGKILLIRSVSIFRNMRDMYLSKVSLLFMIEKNV